MSKYSVQRIFRIYNDTTGDFFEVRDDSDGLDGIELFFNTNGEQGDATYIQREMIYELIRVLKELEDTPTRN